MKKRIGILFNQAGWVLVLINGLIVVEGLYEKGWQNRTFHWTYEPLAIKIASIINLPAMIVAGIFDSLFFEQYEQHSTSVHITESFLWLMILCGIVQWLIVGEIYSLVRTAWK